MRRWKSVDVIIEARRSSGKKVYSLIMLNKLGYLTDDGMAGDTTPDMSAVINKAILPLKVIRPELEISTQLENLFPWREDPWRVIVRICWIIPSVMRPMRLS